MLFIETDSPPPFYQAQLSHQQRQQLDAWFVGQRSQDYYTRRFKAFDEEGKLSAKWHWAAFFATAGWLLYRKRYIDAIVYCVAGWSFIQLNVVLVLVSLEFAVMHLVADSLQMPLRIGIGLAIWLFWSVMVARWSDAYYYRVARREVADAITYHPRDQAAQKSHLKKEGGTSLFGLGLALVGFVFAIFSIQVQFLPLYAKPKENEWISSAYETGRQTARQIDAVYRSTGVCTSTLPSDLQHNAADAPFTMQVVQQVAGVPQVDCALQVRFSGVGYPNRNLNGQQITFYLNSSVDNRWQCRTSLNSKQTPRGCFTTEDLP